MTAEKEKAVFEQLLSQSDSISIRSVLRVVVSRWHWIAVSVGVASMLCYLFLKTATPNFEASATIRFHDKQSELDDLKGKNPALILWRTPKEYLAEKYNVVSPGLVENTLRKENSLFSFRRLKDLRRIDVYPFRPLLLTVLSADETYDESGIFELDEHLVIHYTSETYSLAVPVTTGAVVHVPGLSFRIDSVVTDPGFCYEFSFESLQKAAESTAARIALSEVEEQLPIMRLSFRAGNEAYARTFLQNLLAEYSHHTLQQKQASTHLTMRFISEQKQIFADSLRQAALELELFKKQNQLHDVQGAASDLTLRLRELEQEQRRLEIQSTYIGLLAGALSDDRAETIDYLSIGLDATSDAVLIRLMDQYNQQLARHTELSQHFTEEFPSMKMLNLEIRKLKSQITDNVRLQREKNERATLVLQQTIANHRRLFNQLPRQERNYLYLQSKFEAHQSIYSLLLNKEVEASIMKAGILPPFTVLSPPVVRQLFPKKNQLWAIFIFVGFASGIGAIFTKRAVSEKFCSFEVLQKQNSIILAGIVPRFEKKLRDTPADISTLYQHRGIFTERINAIRTRIVFSPTNHADKTRGKLILVTSEQAGEGKSFITLNLAISLVKTGKKALVIGADLRKPGIDRFFVYSQAGLSEWLQSKTEKFHSLIKNSAIEGLDYISSGQPPAQPGELLMRPRFGALLATVATEYDYVLIDTAPIGLVPDNVPLLGRADYVVFVIRWLYSSRNSYQTALQLSRDYDHLNTLTVVNDTYTDHLYDTITRQVPDEGRYNSYAEYPAHYHSYFASHPPGFKKKLTKFWSGKKG